MRFCEYITVITTTIVLWLKHRMKHISSRDPYLPSRKAANSASLLSAYKSLRSLHLWNDALIFILVFSLARSDSLLLHCFSSSVLLFFFFLSRAMVGRSLALLPLHHFLQFKLEHIWTGKSRDFTCAREGHCPVHTVGGRGAASSMHKSDWHFSDTPLGSDWLCWFRSSGFLQIKIQPLGGARDRIFLHSRLVSHYLIYCQIIWQFYQI